MDIAADDSEGRWGPAKVDPAWYLEMVLTSAGSPTTHFYRSPFPRSSAIVNLRAEKLLEADKSAAAIVALTRPRGYFGLPRDRITLDGQSPPGVPPGVAGIDTSKLKLADGAAVFAVAAGAHTDRPTSTPEA